LPTADRFSRTNADLIEQFLESEESFAEQVTDVVEISRRDPPDGDKDIVSRSLSQLLLEGFPIIRRDPQVGHLQAQFPQGSFHRIPIGIANSTGADDFARFDQLVPGYQQCYSRSTIDTN